MEAASLSESGQDVFLSFDQIPFLRDWSIFNKLSFVESLLKTIYKANLGIQKITFLVDHQVMEDDHLDFSKSWPVDGFLENEPFDTICNANHSGRAIIYNEEIL